MEEIYAQKKQRGGRVGLKKKKNHRPSMNILIREDGEIKEVTV